MKASWKVLFVALLAATPSITVAHQDGVVRGTVRDPEGNVLPYPLAELVTAQGEVVATQIGHDDGSYILHAPRPEEYRGDKSDFPQFAERRQGLGAGIKGALFDLAGLLVWNIILAGLAFSAFLRTDVR